MNEWIKAPAESETSRTPTPSSDRKSPYTLEMVRTTCLFVLTILACGAVLYWLRPVVVPFLVALALFYLLSPLKGWLIKRFGCSESMGLAGMAIISLGILTVIGILVWVCVAQISRDADSYAARLAELSSQPTVVRVVEWAGLERDPSTGRIILITVEQSRRLVRTAASWLESLVADTFLVLVFLLFMLMGGSSAAAISEGWPEEVASRVRRYLTEMFFFSVITGVLVGGIFGILGVKFWVAFGFLAFVLNFIPTLGSILAAVLPLPVILLDPDLSVPAKVLAMSLPILVDMIIANVIQPRFQSRTQGVHPVASMMALIVFGMLWGAVGAVLAVPLLAALKIAFERIPVGKPFANLLAGKLQGGAESMGGGTTSPQTQ